MLGIILHLPMRQIDLQKNLKKMQTGLNLDFMDMVLMNQRLTGRMKLLIALN